MNSGLPWSPGLWQGVGALVIDPQNSNTLYATMAGKVFRSTDGAASWSEVNANLPVSFVSTLMMDPKNPGTVYAGTYGGGIFTITWVAGIRRGAANLGCLTSDPDFCCPQP